MFPMCWKCCNQITEENPTSEAGFTSYKLVGCKESGKVVDMETAVKFCPLNHPKGTNVKIGKPR